MTIQMEIDHTPANHRTTSENIEWLDTLVFYGLIIFAVLSCIAKIGALSALIVTAVLILIRNRKSPYQKKFPSGLIEAYILFIVLLIPSLAFSPNLHSNLRPFLHMSFSIVPFLLAWFGIMQKKQIIPLIAALALSLAVSSVSIIYQGFASGLYLNLRFISFGYFCMITSGFMGILLPLLGLVVIEQRGLNPWLKAGLIAASFVGAIALLINMNRGVWISMVVITLVYLLVNLKKRQRCVTALILFTFCVLSVTMVSQFRTRAESIWNESVSLAHNYQLIFQENPKADFEKIIKNTGKDIPERIYVWNDTWRMFREHPWIGVGLGSVGDVFKSGRGYIYPLAGFGFHSAKFHGHNNFLQFLAAAGIFGFLGFTGLFALVLLMSFCRYKRNPTDWWSLVGFLVTVSFLIQGLTEYNYVHAPLVRLYWFVFGVSMAASFLSSDNVGKIK